jgi:hypothetical protein
LFLVSLGILSIQFLMSLLWSDFLKPMGIGFVGTVMGWICVIAKWQYAYLIPYAHPGLAMNSLNTNTKAVQVKGQVKLSIDIFTQEVYVSLIVAVVVFILGFYIVQKKSVK